MMPDPQATSPQPAPPLNTVRFTEMLDLMIRLADLLAHETTLLREGRVRDIAPLQTEKLRLSQRYQKALTDIAAGGYSIAALPSPLRAQIVAASHRLAETVTENERSLRIGRAAARRLLDCIVESVQTRLQPLNRYNARRAPARNGTMLAMALDRRL